MITGFWLGDLLLALGLVYVLWDQSTAHRRYIQVEHIRYYRDGHMEVDLSHPKFRKAVRKACKTVERIRTNT